MQLSATVALRAVHCWLCRSEKELSQTAHASLRGNRLPCCLLHDSLLIPILGHSQLRECLLNRHCPRTGARRPVPRHRTRAKRLRATQTPRPRSASAFPASSPTCCRCCLRAQPCCICCLLLEDGLTYDIYHHITYRLPVFLTFMPEPRPGDLLNCSACARLPDTFGALSLKNVF